MDFDFSGPQPLFVQVADQLRAGIASGALPEGEQVPSTTEISGCAARNGSDLSAIASPTWWRRRGDWESVARSLSG